MKNLLITLFLGVLASFAQASTPITYEIYFSTPSKDGSTKVIKKEIEGEAGTFIAKSFTLDKHDDQSGPPRKYTVKIDSLALPNAARNVHFFVEGPPDLTRFITLTAEREQRIEFPEVTVAVEGNFYAKPGVAYTVWPRKDGETVAISFKTTSSEGQK